MTCDTRKGAFGFCVKFGFRSAFALSVVCNFSVQSNSTLAKILTGGLRRLIRDDTLRNVRMSLFACRKPYNTTQVTQVS